jgi:hypothetical protein
VTNVLLALAMFVCAALIDFAYARQTIATTNGRALAAANWRAIAYSFGCFGWLVAIKVGMWLLPFELAGLYLGTLVGVNKARGQRGLNHDRAPVAVISTPSGVQVDG